jgi:putative FmdB family regulatory protein
MPIYEYTCLSCQQPSELLLKSASAKPECPHCGSGDLERRFSTFAAHDGASPSKSCQVGESCPSPCCSTGQCPVNL